MRLKYKLTSMEIGGELMAIPVDADEDFRGIFRMNETAAVIIDALASDTSEDALVNTLASCYDAPEETLRHSVQRILALLREKELLID